LTTRSDLPHGAGKGHTLTQRTTIEIGMGRRTKQTVRERQETIKHSKNKGREVVRWLRCRSGKF